MRFDIVLAPARSRSSRYGQATIVSAPGGDRELYSLAAPMKSPSTWIGQLALVERARSHELLAALNASIWRCPATRALEDSARQAIDGISSGLVRLSTRPARSPLWSDGALGHLDAAVAEIRVGRGVLDEHGDALDPCRGRLRRRRPSSATNRGGLIR